MTMTWRRDKKKVLSLDTKHEYSEPIDNSLSFSSSPTPWHQAGILESILLIM